MNNIIREKMDYDVVIVGAGPAGLSASIKIKQMNPNLNVVVLEKGSEVGAHILSGAILDPCGLDLLFPNWKNKSSPVKVKVKKDKFFIFGPSGSIKIPNFLLPPFMNNHNNYIVSMGNVCRWLASEAEELGVEIFPGMSCSEIVYGSSGEVKGVIAGEFGKNKKGEIGQNYEPGMELFGKYTLFSEGVRGSLSQKLIKKFKLDKEKEPQKYGIGIKEVWDVNPENHKIGEVVHSMGWPLGKNAGGGSFLYHAENNQIFVGFVTHLNYKNPYLSPYMEFQRFKHHPMIKSILSGGKRIAYGARAISEGGLQSVPKLTFPGGALLGCSAGFVNVPRIKGNHNAMLSGISAGEAVVNAISNGRKMDHLNEYEDKVLNGYISKDLKKVKNVKPLWSNYGMFASLILGGIDMWISHLFSFNILGTLKHKVNDAESTGKISNFKKIKYPKTDGIISFDRLTNVSFSGTNHYEDQPCHLRLNDKDIPVLTNLPLYDEPAQRYCPAGVYEIIYENDIPKFQINSQNCVHCKTCDIKDPSQNIVWNIPNGGDGPNYPNM